MASHQWDDQDPFDVRPQSPLPLPSADAHKGQAHFDDAFYRDMDDAAAQQQHTFFFNRSFSFRPRDHSRVAEKEPGPLHVNPRLPYGLDPPMSGASYQASPTFPLPSGHQGSLPYSLDGGYEGMGVVNPRDVSKRPPASPEEDVHADSLFYPCASMSDSSPSSHASIVSENSTLPTCPRKSRSRPIAIAARPTTPSPLPTPPTVFKAYADDEEGGRRESQDAYLVGMRQRGYSYKEIRAGGNFYEAESTLRGRYRTLTKDREQRVRTPKWTDNDVSGFDNGEDGADGVVGSIGSRGQAGVRRT